MNAKQERRKEKDRQRAAKKARFRKEADDGKSRKDAESRARFNPNRHAHLVANCGNVGCDRCRS